MIDGLIIVGILCWHCLFSKHRQLAITHHAIDDSHAAAGNDPRRRNDPNASSVRCIGASADNDHWVRLCRNRGDRFPAAAVGGTNESTAAERGVVMFPERSLKNSNFVVLGHHLGRQSLLFGQLLEAQVGMEVSVTYLEESQQYIITDKNRRRIGLVGARGRTDTKIDLDHLSYAYSNRRTVRADSNSC